MSNVFGYVVGRMTSAGLDAIPDDELREKLDLRGGHLPSWRDDVRIEDLVWAAQQELRGYFQRGGGDSLIPYQWALNLTLQEVRRELLVRDEDRSRLQEEVALAEAVVRKAERDGGDLIEVRRRLTLAQRDLRSHVERNEADVAALKAVLAERQTATRPTARGGAAVAESR